MTDIEALRARMREAAAARSRPRDLPLYAAVDAVKAFNEAATLDAVLALDAYITRLREDMDRVTRERDEARADAASWQAQAQRVAQDAVEFGTRAEAAEAALAKRDEEVARLRGVLEGVCEYWNGGAESALDAIQEVERRAAEALTKEPPDAD